VPNILFGKSSGVPNILFGKSSGVPNILFGSRAQPNCKFGTPDGEKWTDFYVQSNNYWSGTTNADNADNAWNVNMNNGNVNNDDKTNTNYVWPVRGGE